MGVTNNSRRQGQPMWSFITITKFENAANKKFKNAQTYKSKKERESATKESKEKLAATFSHMWRQN